MDKMHSSLTGGIWSDAYDLNPIYQSQVYILNLIPQSQIQCYFRRKNTFSTALRMT
jgi:hypothetical protein